MVLAEKLAIEHSPYAKSFRDDRVQRPLEWSRPQGMRTGLVICGRLGGFFPVDALQRFRIRTGEAALDGKRFGGDDGFTLFDGDADLLYEGHR